MLLLSSSLLALLPAQLLPGTSSVAPHGGRTDGRTSTALTVQNLGLAIRLPSSPTGGGSDPAVSIGRRYLPLLVLEADQGGADLDGDGEANGAVLHVHDRATGLAQNTGLSCEKQILPFVHQGTVGVLLREADVDLNGDGDVFDNVAHLYDPRGHVLNNLRLAVPASFVSVTPRRFFQRRGSMVLELTEAGSEDFNGDGDSEDVALDLQLLGGRSGILPRRPAVARQTAAPRLATGRFPAASSLLSLDDDWFVFGVDEPDEGGRDLNGDGDADDANVIHFTDARTGVTSCLGIAGNFFQQVPGRLAFRASEAAEGRDLNADGDALDDVLHCYDFESGILTNVGLAVTLVEAQPGAVSALVSEAAHGAADLNGDGDATDHVVFVHDPATGTSANLGLAATLLGGVGNKVLFPVSEAGQGQTDLNGDGDTKDFVLHAHDLPSGATFGLATALTGALFGERFVVVFVHEPAQGADFNFDGDVQDLVLGVYDALTDTFSNTALAIDAQMSRLAEHGPYLAVGVREKDQGASDLNGDGDTSDLVAHVLEPAAGTSTNLGLAIGLPNELGMAHGRLLLPVFEVAQGVDLNGDGDLQDGVAHLLELP